MKKNIVCLFTGLFIWMSYVYCQAPGSEEEEIRKMEMIWMTALSKKDSITLNQSLASNFELAKIGGLASTNINREQWLKNSLEMDWSNFAFTSMQIKVDSNIATVNSNLSFKLRPYPFRLSSGILDVWRKTDGRWKVEKRYLGQDNLSRWLLIFSGIGIGVGFIFLIRWIKSIFSKKTPG
jgi:hypothetical protein